MSDNLLEAKVSRRQRRHVQRLIVLTTAMFKVFQGKFSESILSHATLSTGILPPTALDLMSCSVFEP